MPLDKDELKYRLDLTKYYLSSAGDKFSGMSKMMQTVSIVVVVALVLVGLSFTGIIGGLNSSSPDSTDQSAVPVDNSPAEVPDLKFVKQTDAVVQLRNAGFSNVSAKQIPQYADASVAEVVLEQNPAAGTTVKKSDPIVLNYGSKDLYTRGQLTKPVPNTKGMVLYKAREALDKAGFTNVSYNIPAGRTTNEFVVTSSDPTGGTNTKLNAKITLAVTPGMDIKLFIDSIKRRYIPYAKFSSVTNPSARQLIITLKSKDASLNTQEKIDEQARLYKVGLEQVTNETLDGVKLVNPGGLTGDSATAVANVTAQGLTIPAARAACEKAGDENFDNLEINWETGRLTEIVSVNGISLSVNAQTKNSADVVQNIVIKCGVSGSSESPVITSFSAS